MLLAGAGVGGLILAAAIGIGAAGESEKIREQLKGNEENEGREPFLDGGNGEPIAGRIVGGGGGDVECDAMSTGDSGGAENLACAFIGRGAG